MITRKPEPKIVQFYIAYCGFYRIQRYQSRFEGSDSGYSGAQGAVQPRDEDRGEGGVRGEWCGDRVGGWDMSTLYSIAASPEVRM